MKTRIQGLLFAAALVAAPAVQAGDLAGEVNGIYAFKNWGAEAGLSYRMNLEAMGLAGVHITPTAGALVRKNNTSDIGAYGRIEASVSIATFEVGAGGRYDSQSEKLRPYATARLGVLPWIGVKANAGKDYYALGLVFNY
jgi:hypothetical protein